MNLLVVGCWFGLVCLCMSCLTARNKVFIMKYLCVFEYNFTRAEHRSETFSKYCTPKLEMANIVELAWSSQTTSLLLLQCTQELCAVIHDFYLYSFKIKNMIKGKIPLASRILSHILPISSWVGGGDAHLQMCSWSGWWGDQRPAWELKWREPDYRTPNVHNLAYNEVGGMEWLPCLKWHTCFSVQSGTSR